MRIVGTVCYGLALVILIVTLSLAYQGRRDLGYRKLGSAIVIGRRYYDTGHHPATASDPRVAVDPAEDGRISRPPYTTLAVSGTL